MRHDTLCVRNEKRSFFVLEAGIKNIITYDDDDKDILDSFFLLSNKLEEFM